MPFPEYEDMDDSLLCFILLNGGDAHKVTANSTYEPLADFFGLTRDERVRQRRDGRGGSQWHNRVQWDRQRLINHGYLDGKERGFWKLTPEGFQRASSIVSKYTSLKQ
jgi:restriction endonuclease Mrr